MTKRKSQAQKRSQGTDRPDRIRHDPQIEPLESLPRAPASLDKTAQAEWRRLGGSCIRRGTLTRGDLPALERASEACAIAGRLAREASEAETFSTGGSGQDVVNPLFGAAKGWTAEARNWLTVLGLSPSSRSSVEAVVAPVQSEFAEFLARRKPIGTVTDG